MRVKWNRQLDGSLSRNDSEESQQQNKEEPKHKELPKIFRLFRRKKHRQSTADVDPTPSEADDDDRASISSMVSQPVSELFHRDRTQSLFSSFRLSFTSSKKKPKRTPVSLLFQEKVQESSRFSSPDLRREKFGSSDASVKDSGFQSLRQLPLEDSLKEGHSHDVGRNVYDSPEQIELSKSSPCVKENAFQSLAQLPVDNSSSLNQLTPNKLVKVVKHLPEIYQPQWGKRDSSEQILPFTRELESAERIQPQPCQVKRVQRDAVLSVSKICDPDSHQIEVSGLSQDLHGKFGYIPSSTHSSKHNGVHQDVKTSKSVSFFPRSLSPVDVTCKYDALSKRKSPVHSAEDSNYFYVDSLHPENISASHRVFKNKGTCESSNATCEIYCGPNSHSNGDRVANESDFYVSNEKLDFQEKVRNYVCGSTRVLANSVDTYSAYCDSVLDANFREVSGCDSRLLKIDSSRENAVPAGANVFSNRCSKDCDSTEGSYYCERNLVFNSPVLNCDFKDNAEHLDMVLNEEKCVENESEVPVSYCEGDSKMLNALNDLQCESFVSVGTERLPSEGVELLQVSNKDIAIPNMKNHRLVSFSEENDNGINFSASVLHTIYRLPYNELTLKDCDESLVPKCEVSDQSNVICGVRIGDTCNFPESLNHSKLDNTENCLKHLQSISEHSASQLYCNCLKKKKLSLLSSYDNISKGALTKSLSFESYFDRETLETRENSLKLQPKHSSSKNFVSLWNVSNVKTPNPDITSRLGFPYRQVHSSIQNGILCSEDNFRINLISPNVIDNLICEDDSFPRNVTDREKNQSGEDEDRCPDASTLRPSGQFVTLHGFDLHTEKEENDSTPCCSVDDKFCDEFDGDISMLSNFDNDIHVSNGHGIISKDFRSVYDCPVCDDDVKVTIENHVSYLGQERSGKCLESKIDSLEAYASKEKECAFIDEFCSPEISNLLSDVQKSACPVNKCTSNDQCYNLSVNSSMVSEYSFSDDTSGDKNVHSNELDQKLLPTTGNSFQAKCLGDCLPVEISELHTAGQKNVAENLKPFSEGIFETRQKNASEENIYNGVKERIEMFENGPMGKLFSEGERTEISLLSSNSNHEKNKLSFIPSLRARNKLSRPSRTICHQQKDKCDDHQLNSQNVSISSASSKRHPSSALTTKDKHSNFEFDFIQTNIHNGEVDELTGSSPEKTSGQINRLVIPQRTKSEEGLILEYSKSRNRRHSSATLTNSELIYSKRETISSFSTTSEVSLFPFVVQSPNATLNVYVDSPLTTITPPLQGQCGLQARCTSLPLVIGQVHGSASRRGSSFIKDASSRKSRIPRKQTGGRGNTLKQPPVRPPLWLSKAELSQEIQRLGSLCEVRTKELNRLKMETKHVSVGFDAFAALFKYMVEDLNGLSVPLLSEDLKKTLKQLELAKQDLAYYEREVEELKAHHSQELNDLSNKLFEVFQGEVTELSSKHQEEVNCLKEDHQKQIESLSETFDATSEDHRAKQEAIVAKLQQELINQRDELQLFHEKELQDLEEKHAQSTKTLQEHIEQLQKKCAELKQHSMGMEDAMRKDTDTKLQWVTSRKGDLEKEVESLKAVLEMKNKELHTIRVQNLEMEKQLEELPLAREKIKMLQARAEDLEALMIEKTKLERELSTENQQIKETFEKETKVNRRISMENEELQWRLRQVEQSVISGSFSDVSEYPEEVENGTISPVKSPPQMNRSIFFTFVDKDCSSPRSQYRKITPGFSANYKISPAKSSPPVPSPRRAKSHSEPAEPSNLTSTPRKVGKQPSLKQKKLKRSGSECSSRSTMEHTNGGGSLSATCVSMASSVGSECSVFEQRENLLEEHKEEILQSLEILREQQIADENGIEGKVTENSTLLENGDMTRSAEFSDPKTYYHMTFPAADTEDGGSKVVSPENDSAQLAHSNLDVQEGNSGCSASPIELSVTTPLVGGQQSPDGRSRSTGSLHESETVEDKEG